MSRPAAEQPPEIPQPSLLDPDRGHLQSSLAGGSAEDRLQVLDESFHAVADYGQQLWQVLDDVRHYLLEAAPAAGRASARPTDAADEAGWAEWQRAYAAVTSTLAGPRGDSGFGVSEAAREAGNRRAAPPGQHELAPAVAAGWQPAPAVPQRLATVLTIAGVTLVVRELAGRLWRSR
ncbi:MAG TPA: hypothetical protein VHO01_09975 [Jatrophihabitans sp.]|nr:hypothetical protein [Jatrophihabitans sp.]